MNKILLIIFLAVFLQVFHSCKKTYSTTELNANFTTEQITELNKITEFFKKQACSDMNSDFKTCYKKTNHDSLQASGYGFWFKIEFDKQKELYKEISKSTFNEIWMFCESTFYPSEIKAKSLCAVATGKYQNYLADLGKTNSRIAKYANKIKAYGDFNGLDIQYWEVLKDEKSFDLNDPNIQLILAIHYLSINDQNKRNPRPKRKAPKFK